MKKRFRNWLKRKFNLYDIKDLTAGGHCGCCGQWVKDEILPITPFGGITLCDRCM